jgi:hypothetical protein
MELKQTMLAEYTLTVPEAAAMLGETEKVVHHWIYTARLDALRVRGEQGHEFRVRPSDVLARKAEVRAAAAPAEPPRAGALAAGATPCCQAEWAGVCRDLFVRYDRLGRRAARLERENHALRQTLKQMQAGATRGGAGPAGPCGAV